MLKYIFLGLLAVSCRGAPLNDGQTDDVEEQSYASALIKFNGYENDMLPPELCTDDKIVVNFKLYTRENPNGYELSTMNNQTFKNSSFNVKHDTKVLIHEWLQNETYSYAKDFVSAYLKNKREKGIQVIVVDYGSVSRCQFNRAREMQPKIGEQVGELLKSLMKYGQVPSKVHIIGLGMGAQIAGYSARQIHPRKIGRLTALDPTFIGYLEHQPQLKSNDSDFMDVIHTAQRKFGSVRHLGNARFYPNDGTRQPMGNGKSPLDASVLSHLASVFYYLESIVDITYFKARLCNNYVSYLRNKCQEPAVYNYMGDEANIKLFGNFYLQVQSPVPPFGNRELDVKVFELVHHYLVTERGVVVLDETDVEIVKKTYEKKRTEDKTYTNEEIANLINKYGPKSQN
ncbi:pancreatic triacylglycerol lipase-like [Planococcus citri]|uniref:pancreatic triacylglycerol lipase-like n=1 Tax=Planococcus citri TaxID=170843 RepID=UPI0031F742CA